MGETNFTFAVIMFFIALGLSIITTLIVLINDESYTHTHTILSPNGEKSVTVQHSHETEEIFHEHE